jgi:hypothetical protein
VETGTIVLCDWRNWFPNVPDIAQVAAGARFVAENEMPLMIADASWD